METEGGSEENVILTLHICWAYLFCEMLSELFMYSSTGLPLNFYVKLQNTVPHTTIVQLSCLLQRCANDILRILVKAQPSTRSTGPRSPTRLGIRSQDLGLPNAVADPEGVPWNPSFEGLPSKILCANVLPTLRSHWS